MIRTYSRIYSRTAITINTEIAYEPGAYEYAVLKCQQLSLCSYQVPGMSYEYDTIMMTVSKESNIVTILVPYVTYI